MFQMSPCNFITMLVLIIINIYAITAIYVCIIIDHDSNYALLIIFSSFTFICTEVAIIAKSLWQSICGITFTIMMIFIM